MKHIGLMTKDEVIEYLGFDDRELRHYLSGKDNDIRPLPCHKLDKELVFFYDEVAKWEKDFDNFELEIAKIAIEVF